MFYSFDWKGFCASMVGAVIGIGLLVAVASATSKSKITSHNDSPSFSQIVSNPALMHMRRREFIAAGIAQGLAANGGLRTVTPEDFAKLVMRYADALMLELDKKGD